MPPGDQQDSLEFFWQISATTNSEITVPTSLPYALYPESLNEILKILNEDFKEKFINLFKYSRQVKTIQCINAITLNECAGFKY